MDLKSNGVAYEADIVAFIVGRHDTGDGEAMEPFYHERSAAVSKIIFETTVGGCLLRNQSCYFSVDSVGRRFYAF